MALRLFSLRYRILRENKKHIHYNSRIKGNDLHILVIRNTKFSRLQTEYVL